ncbi:MAG: acyltransferase [Lachnospiraceae bacterium]
MSDKNSARQRFSHIDLLKFIAMFAVLIYHSYIYPWEFNVHTEPSASFNYNCMGIFSVCVPLFFLVNGYLLLNRPLDLKKHIKKTCRLTVITVTWAMIYMLILMPFRQEYFSVSELITAVMTWKEGWIHHLWFMGALVCLYIFFPLLKTAYDHYPRVFLYFLIICAVMTFGNKFLNMLAVLTKYLLTGTGIAFNTNWFNIFNPFAGMYGYSIVYFGLGGLLFKAEPQIRKKISGKRNVILTFFLMCSCILMAVWGQFYYRTTDVFWDIVFKGYDTLPVLFNVLVLYCFSLFYQPEKENLITRFIELVSSNTLGIYFMHQLLFYMTVEQLKTIPLLCTLPGGVLYSFAALCVCTLLTWSGKKIPVIRMLF